MGTLTDELRNISRSLNKAGIDYAVCGGLALTIYGFPRATFDIDLLIEPSSLEEALKVVGKHGFDIKGLDMSFKERAVEIRRVSKALDDGEILSLDLLLVTDQIKDVWRSRIELEWEFGVIPIISKEGLIRMKELAGRPKDIIDIETITNEEN